MENLKLCEIITSGDYGSMTDLTDNQRKFVTLHTEVCRSYNGTEFIGVVVKEVR